MTRASLWRWVLALWALSTLCAVFLRPITPIDETRYLTVAWEMRLAGNLWLPTLNGVPYSDKPPLLFWLINAGWNLFGVNDIWPRVLTAGLGLGVAVLTARCAELLLPRRAGIGPRAALALTAIAPWLLFNGAVMFDVLMTFFTLSTIVLLLSMRGAGEFSQWAAGGIALGLGMLAKGPAAMLQVLPLAILAPLWKGSLEGTETVDWRGWYRGVLFLIGSSVLILAVWLVPAIRHGGEEFLDQLIWRQTIERMATTTHHLRPVWFYVALLPALLFPWWLSTAVWRGLREVAAKRRALVRVVLSWTVPVFIAFSLFRGKQLHYLFPLLPAVAVVVAAATGESVSGYKRALAPAAKLAAIIIIAVYLTITVGYKEAYDVRPMAGVIAGLQQRGIAVAHVGRYHGQFQFAGRLTHPLRVLRNDEEWRAFKAEFPDGYVITYSRDADRIATTDSTATPAFSQRFRSRSMALWSVKALHSVGLDVRQTEPKAFSITR